MSTDPRATTIGASAGPLAAVLLVGVLVVERNLTMTGEWVATQYLFTYQDGLRRRALVGSVLRLVSPDAPVTLELVTALGLLQLLVFVTLAALLTSAVVRREHAERTTALILGLLVVASTHTRMLVVDVGRSDVLLLSLLLVVALLTIRDPRAGLVALPPLIIVGLLVHDIALIATAPLMTAMVLHRIQQLDRPRPWIAALAASAGLTAVAALGFLATAGRDRGVAESAIAAAGGRATFPPTPDAVWIQSSSTVDNVRLALGRVMDVGPIPVLVLLLVAIPACLIALGATTLRHDRSRSTRVLGAAALSPLLLMLVGTDYGRWTTLAVLNALVLSLWSRGVVPWGHRDGAEPRRPALDARRPGILLLVILAIVLPSPSRGGLVFPGVMTSSGAILRRSAEELVRLLTG